jgi:hypothetical protein
MFGFSFKKHKKSQLGNGMKMSFLRGVDFHPLSLGWREPVGGIHQ